MPRDELLVNELTQSIAQLNLQLDASQIRQLRGHLDMLAQWGKVYNLTAIREPVDMLRQHLLDSLESFQRFSVVTTIPSWSSMLAAARAFRG